MKKYLKFLWLILIIIAIIFCFKNLKMIKFYYLSFLNSNQQITFSIFNKTITNDAFFSIPIGERILKEGITKIDNLTWHENLKFTNDRWLFDIFIYKIYDLFSINGIVYFISIMTIVIGITLFLILKSRGINNILAIIFTLTAVYLSRNMFHARAQIISFWLFMLEFIFIEKLLETNKKVYKIFLVIIPILIANIHASVFLISIVIYLPYVVEAVLVFLKTKLENKKNKFKTILYSILDKFEIEKRENTKSLFILFIITLFSGLITPIGLAPYISLIKAMDGVSTTFIGELQASTIYNNKMFYIIFVISFIIAILPKIKVKIVDMFFILGFAIMTIKAYRSVYFFYLIGMVSVARILMQLINTYKIDINQKIAQICISISFAIVAITLYSESFFLYQSQGVVDESIYPVKASNYILENIDIANMRIYNDFNWGSYLEFMGIKAFIDSRSGMFCSEFNSGVTILEDWLKISNEEIDYNEAFDKYKITHVLVRNVENLNEKIGKDNLWQKIYNDKNFTLYEKTV